MCRLPPTRGYRSNKCSATQAGRQQAGRQAEGKTGKAAIDEARLGGEGVWWPPGGVLTRPLQYSGLLGMAGGAVTCVWGASAGEHSDSRGQLCNIGGGNSLNGECGGRVAREAGHGGVGQRHCLWSACTWWVTLVVARAGHWCRTWCHRKYPGRLLAPDRLSPALQVAQYRCQVVCGAAAGR